MRATADLILYPGVLLFELRGAPVSKRGVEPLALVDLVDEARQ